MDKPNLFESVVPCSGQYAWKRDLRLNAWLLVATVVYLLQLFLLGRNPEWTPLMRALLALTPIVPGILYIRSWVRFIRGMDELQRRIQLDAHLFAAWSTIMVSLVLSTLHEHGVLHFLPHGLGFGGVLLLAFPLWLLGVGIANCRYK